MDTEVKQAILLAIDALESCVLATFIDDATGEEWEQLDIDEDKVKAALKALQALPWEEDVDTKPEAMRLADFLENQFGLSSAAAQVRRLHAVNAELLEALKEMHEVFKWTSHNEQEDEANKKALIAIAKATGEKA